MKHDARMRETARAIYEAVNNRSERSFMAFEDAESLRSDRYRCAVDAAYQARTCLATDPSGQLILIP